MNSRERERKIEERIDCSICLYFKDCEGRDYCKLAVIGPKDKFPPPSILDISEAHILKGNLVFIRPISEYVLNSLDLPV